MSILTHKTPGLYVCAFDWHYPKVDKPTEAALFDFLEHNDIAGFVLGGDQLDNEEISHHNRRKFLFREPGSYARNTSGFNGVLDRLDAVIDPAATRVWIQGNHDDWEDQLVQEQPELQGTVERRKLLALADRGWSYVPQGHIYRIGKLNVIHGDTLSAGGYAAAQHSQKAVNAYHGSVLYGHFHAPQSSSRVAPFTVSDRYMGWCSPVLAATNPYYLKNRPTAWINGFTVVELAPTGNFNLYPVVVTRGRFTFAGVEYGG